MNGTELTDLINGKLQLFDIDPMFLFVEPNLHEEQIRELWTIVDNSYR